MKFLLTIFIAFWLLTACSPALPPPGPLTDGDEDKDASPSVSDPFLQVSTLVLDQAHGLILKPGETRQLQLNVLLSDGSLIKNVSRDFSAAEGKLKANVVWRSKNADRVVVSDSGVVKALQPGIAQVEATLLGVTSVVSLKINNEGANTGSSVTSLSFSQSFYQIFSRAPLVLNFDAALSNGQVLENHNVDDLAFKTDCDFEFQSLNPDVAGITASGVVLPQKNGLATLQAHCGDAAASATVKIGSAAVACHLGTATQPDGTETLQQISFSASSSEVMKGQGIPLNVDLDLSSGSLQDVTGTFLTPGQSVCSLSVESSDPSIIRIESGRAVAAGYGQARLTVRYKDLSVSKDIIVKAQSEDPINPSDRFLNSNDLFIRNFGPGSGFGQSQFPSIIQGQPYGETHVVSFGTKGSLTIKLNGYVLVDGPGPDFIVFENPVPSGLNTFTERAKVSVSEDGVTFIDFPCDPFDPTHAYEGCAGVTPVNVLVALDWTLSGGDTFDLADLELEQVKYIRLEDLGTCVPGDHTYPVCATVGKMGFDLDALALLNGINE